MNVAGKGPRRSETSRERFATTRWSLLLAARQGNTPGARRALSTLCQLYWYPLYALVRRMGRGPEEARDLVQGFFTQLLEKEQLARVDRQRGRFRPWLITSFKHYLSNEQEREQALKRGAGQVVLSTALEEAESLYGLEPLHGMTPERLYERCWAYALLEHVLSTLREEYVSRGQGLLFERLRGSLTSAAVQDSYQQIAAELCMRLDAVRMAACRLRQRYRDRLRATVSQTLEHPEDTDSELRLLLAAL